MWSKPFSSLKDMYIDVKKLKQLLVQKNPRFFNKKKKNLQILLAKLVERQIIYEKLVSQASFESRKKQPQIIAKNRQLAEFTKKAEIKLVEGQILCGKLVLRASFDSPSPKSRNGEN